MKPERKEMTFEKVKLGEFVEGVIEDVAYDQKHKFSFPGQPPTEAPGVRLVFNLKGYAFKHYSSWMRFSYAEKSNLYQKYLSALVENAKPDMDFDLDLLKGMKVRAAWVEKNGFQNVGVIFPLEGKINGSNIHPTETKEPPIDDEPSVDVDI